MTSKRANRGPQPPARRGRRLTLLTAGFGLVAAWLPAAAHAHGIVGRADLPIPTWLFAWAAAVVLVISFLALFRLWETARPADRGRRLLAFPAALEWACGALGVGVFAIVVYAGLAGAQDYTSNLAPTFVYVAFWVGVPLASVVLGDFFRAFDPWRAVARLATATARAAGRAPAPLLGGYPVRVGRWPAAATLFGFAWLELVYPSKDDPRLLAVLGLAYAALQLAGMACYGIEAWTGRADGFSVYFGFIGLLAPLRWSRRRLYVRWPLLGARELETLPGTAAVICTMIGSTSFDGFSNSDLWYRIAPPVQRFFEGFGFTAIGGYEVTATLGLALWVLLVAGLYNLGIWGMTRAVNRPRPELVREFLHTLLPIAVGYLLAHYFSLLVLQGQALGYLVSDPLGNGSNLFGSADFLVNYNLVSFAAIWYVQIAAIVGGHVGGLILAHDRGLASFSSLRDSVRAQHWMLMVMVGFTCLALWILSAVSTTTG